MDLENKDLDRKVDMRLKDTLIHYLFQKADY